MFLLLAHMSVCSHDFLLLNLKCMLLRACSVILDKNGRKYVSPITNLNCIRTAKEERLEEISLTLISGLKLKELD